MAHSELQKHDVAIAQKALCLCVDLSGLDKSVGAAILSHFNKKDRRCDPSNERLAKLLGINARQVRRATASLCAAGLFKKRSHGGSSGCASYEPQWNKMRAIVVDWDRRLASGQAPELDAQPDENDSQQQDIFDRDTGQKRPLGQDKNVLQTPFKNPLKEPIAACGTDGPQEPPASSPSIEVFKGLLNGNAWLASQSKPKVASGSDRRRAAENAAVRRWGNDLQALGTIVHAEAIDRMTPEIMAAATEAEMRRHGDGVRLIRDRLLSPAASPGGG